MLSPHVHDDATDGTTVAAQSTEVAPLLQPLDVLIQQISLSGSADSATPAAVPDIMQPLVAPTELPGAGADVGLAADPAPTTSSKTSPTPSTPLPLLAAAPAAAAAGVVNVTVAPPPSVALGPRPVLLLTNEISAAASPADASTNSK